MAGSIRKRADRGPDTWELRIFLGRDTVGRTKHMSRLFRGSERAAQRELGRLVSLHHGTLEETTGNASGDPPRASWGPKTTVNDAIAGWKRNGWEDLSPNTTSRYESIWRTHVRESIGTRTIASLSPYDVEQFFRVLKSKGLSQASVRQTRAMLHRACKLARKWSNGELPNPIADTEIPDWGLSERGKPVRAPSTHEVQALLRAARQFDPRIAVFIRLVAATGARRGEICAIRWSDIDWSSKCVTIDESVVCVGGGARIRSPKTHASIRVVYLDEGTMAELATHHRSREERASVCECSLSSDGFVFSTEPSGAAPPHPDPLSHGFAVVREQAGLAGDIHLHSLRHFQATLLDPVISEKQKQARLGWATVQMARHYTDSVAEEDRRAAVHVGRALDGISRSARRKSPVSGGSRT